MKTLLTKLAGQYKKIKDSLQKPYTAIALDELGRPIMQSNNNFAKVVSTPLKDIEFVTTALTVPFIQTLGLNNSLKGVITGLLSSYIGGQAVEYGLGKAGANEDLKEMGKDIGSSINFFPGFKFGLNHKIPKDRLYAGIPVGKFIKKIYGKESLKDLSDSEVEQAFK